MLLGRDADTGVDMQLFLLLDLATHDYLYLIQE